MRIFKISQTSDEFDWHDKGETFDYIMRKFDVNAARQIIKQFPRDIIEVDLEYLARLVPRSKDIVDENGNVTGIRMGVGVNWERIDSGEETFDLSFPIIIATIQESFIPIDGWHRIAKAVEEGVNILPGVILTEEETKRTML